MKQARTGAFVLLAAGLLTSCVLSAKQPTQQFSATTSLQENRVVTVRNLGPENVWLDPNHCPEEFKVGVQERLPSIPSLIGDVCLTILRFPEFWKVGEAKVGLLPNIRLPAGTYTVTAWAEPKIAPNLAGKPGKFDTVRVQAPTVVLKVP